jgi:hypothetical protein
VVGVLLGTLGAVTRSQEPTGRVWSQAGLKPGGLGVVVVTVAVVFRDVLKDNTPEAFDINGPTDLDVVDLTGAQVALGSNPVTDVIWTGSLGGSSIVVVVEALLLVGSDVVHQVIGRLVSHVGVLL